MEYLIKFLLKCNVIAYKIRLRIYGVLYVGLHMIFLAKHYLFCVYDVLYFFKGILKKIKRLFMICPKILISTKFLKSNKF